MSAIPSAKSALPELAVQTGDPGRGAKAAREFEAHLIGALLESLEKTFAAVPGKDALPGGDEYQYLGAQSLAEGLAEKGGFGIADMISRYLATHAQQAARK